MSDPLPPGCARRFRVVKALAEGGFGTVYLAIQHGLERQVVVKLLKPEACEDGSDVSRFGDEARITARLEHRNVVRVIDHDVDDVPPWIAYEYLPGPSVRALLESGPLDPREAALIGADVAAGVGAAHAAGILHRDLKPDNVMRDGAGAFKVTDFGIAKWSDAAVHTKTGVILGSPCYLSPEQVQGERASERSDVYALGIMLYELLAGEPPFLGAPLQVLQRHLQSRVPAPSAKRPGVPPELDAIVHRATERDPAARYASMAQLKRALDAFADPRAEPVGGSTLPVGDKLPTHPDGRTVRGARRTHAAPARADQPAASPPAAPRRADQPAASPPAAPRRALLLALGALVAAAGVAFAVHAARVATPSPSPAAVAPPSPSATAVAPPSASVAAPTRAMELARLLPLDVLDRKLRPLERRAAAGDLDAAARAELTTLMDAIGRKYDDAGDFGLAVQNYGKWLARARAGQADRERDALRALAMALYRCDRADVIGVVEDRERAIHRLRELAKVAPDPDVHAALSTLLVRSERWQEAIAPARAALAGRSMWWVEVDLARALANTGQHEAAAEMYRVAVEKSEARHVRWELAALLNKLGSKAEACETYRAGLRDDPHQPHCLVGAAVCAEEAGGIPEAAALLERAAFGVSRDGWAQITYLNFLRKHFGRAAALDVCDRLEAHVKGHAKDDTLDRVIREVKTGR